MLQDKQYTTLEDELETTAKRPAVRLPMQQDPQTLLEDELEMTQKHPALRLPMQQDTKTSLEDELETTMKSSPLRLPMQDTQMSLEEELETTVKYSPLRLPMQQDTQMSLEDELETTMKSSPLRLPMQQDTKTPQSRSTVRTWLFQWIKTNVVILVNAGSLISTTAVTSVLGFAYWWVAARWFPPETVGLGSAAISAMILLGTVCMLGLGTLLVGELPRQPGKEGSLISAALIVVGAIGACIGIAFALVAPFIATDLQPLGASGQNVVLFAIGVSLTAMSFVLDQALIGLLRGELQLLRNTFFAVAKLAALFVVSLLLSQKVGLTIYTTWIGGNALSLAVLTGYVIVKKGWSRSTYLPQWGLLRKLGPAALQHQIFNLILQLPVLILPVLVTVLLSATVNAWFYVSFMLAMVISSVSYALTTVLYAVSSARPAILAHKARLTLGLAVVTCILANCVFQLATKQVLGVFGHTYAEQAAWSLRILALGGFPYIIRGHYVAICRIQGRVLHAMLPMAAGTVLELGAAALGAQLGGLTGLSLGWVAALCVEAVFMSPTVFRAIWPRGTSSVAELPVVPIPVLQAVQSPEQISYEPPQVVNRGTRDVSKIRTRLQFPHAVKMPKPLEVASVLLPLVALFLWALSLKYVNIPTMTDLGLVSVLPPATIIALVLLTISFCLTLQQPKLHVPILLLHLFLLIFMLYGLTTLVEEAPRFATVYRHAGYTEYIMRTGTVDPSLDAYFNWPGFFILSAFVTQILGFHDILPLAAWAPVFYNLIYLGPLYLIFTTATTDKRLVWLGLLFFYLTNWIGQDYFSPQGLNFFLYLVIIAILLKWFKVTTNTQQRKFARLGRFSPLVQKFFMWLTGPDTYCTPSQPRQRVALLIGLVLIFAFVVFSHPLTPFFVLASVATLVIFRRCTPRWLPVLMALMTGAWIIFMAQAFLAGHLNFITGDLGKVSSIVTTNVTDRVIQGSPEHIFIGAIRVIMTVALWAFASVGAILRLRSGYRDASYILLAIAPFSLIVANSYGGEMLLRIYLFSLPLMAFFAAAIFYTASTSRRSRKVTVAIIGVSLLLLGGFLFTRYGNERVDYMTYSEVNGVRYLYSIAPADSLLVAGWDGGGPLQLQDYEKYNYASLSDVPARAITAQDVNTVVRLIQSQKHSAAYLFITRSQKAASEISSGLPPGSLDRLEDALLRSGEFRLVYSNADTQILQYVPTKKVGYI